MDEQLFRKGLIATSWGWKQRLRSRFLPFLRAALVVRAGWKRCSCLPPQQPRRQRLLPSQIAQRRRNLGTLVLGPRKKAGTRLRSSEWQFWE